MRPDRKDCPNSLSDLNRREFLIFSAATSAMLMLGDTAWATPQVQPKSYAAFEDLPPGAVQPQGWLRVVLQKQADGLGSNLPKVSWPFTQPYWKGETQGESWWPWEQTAYWIDGAARLALVLDDEALKRQVRETIDYTMAHIDSDGYIGPAYFKDPKPNFHRWPTMIFFRGLEATSDAKGNAGKAIVDAMHSHYVGDTADYGKATRNVTNIEPMLWCYQRTGDKRLLEMAERAWAEYQTVAADPEHGDLSRERVEANTPINAHGVTYQETAKQPAILYANTGKREYLDFALAAQKRAFDHHMLIDGIPSTSEWYRTTTSLDSHETCCITDHTWSWGHLLSATGDGVWGDHIERAVFNAGMGAIKKDWKAVQYFSCPNQMIATLNSDHNAMAYGGRMMAFQPNPGQHTACCGGNVHRLLPNYAIRMWMKARAGGLAATLYGPSKLSTNVKDVPITIEQRTTYPFEEKIVFEIHPERPVSFPLMLRIPTWCKNPTVEFNGKSQKIQSKDGFMTIDRQFKAGDVIALTLPMEPKVSHWPDNGIAVERGPLVYALPVQEIWSTVVEPRYTTAEFPSWNASPASAWNYAIVQESWIDVVQSKVSEDPWNKPPVSIMLSAKRVEGWELRSDPKNPNQKFTPPLPDLTKTKVTENVERIELVPYGATHLRVTIFPQAPKE